MKFDFQLVIQAILHFVTFVLCFVVAIPLGLTMTEFDGECTLYNEFVKKDDTHFGIIFSSKANCNYPIYGAVVILMYSLVLGIYYTLRVCLNKDTLAGFQIWEAFIIGTNALTVIFMLVACCMISVGLKSSCDSFLNFIEHSTLPYKVCSDIKSINWILNSKQKSGLHFYEYPNKSQITGWITFLVCVALLSLSILRFVRSHRHRSGNTTVQSGTAASTQQSPTMDKF